MIHKGGKTIYGAAVGVMMLETQFPRIHGDIGNALTWPFPVQFKVVRGATPHNIVRDDPMKQVDAFIAAGQELLDLGCDGLTTNCGFLSLIQDEVRTALGCPVATSSLMQVPMAQQLLPPDKRVGILTICAETLSEAHLRAAGITSPAPIVGTDNGRAFTAQILEDQEILDVDACRLDLLDAATELVTQHENIGAIVLECTNMVPYAGDIRHLTGLPVYSIYTLVSWFQSGLLPRRFDDQLHDPRLGLVS